MGVVIGNDVKTDEIIVGGSQTDGVELGSKTPVLRGPRGYSNYELALQNGFQGTEEEYLKSLKGEPGTNDYNEQINKPKINGVELIGNKTSEELNLQNKLTAGENIEITNNKINVLTSDKVEKDNTKPITASAVYTEVGNINILLKTI